MLSILLLASAEVCSGQAPDKRLADAIAAAARDTPAWRLDDLTAAREKVSDAENSAIIAARVAAMLPSGWPKAETEPGLPNPTQGPVAQAFDVVTAGPDNARIDPAAAAGLRNDLAGRSDAVRPARTLADFKRGRHELKLTVNPYEILLTETQRSRDVARLLQADALTRAEAGDLDAALDSCRAMLGVERSIGDEPMVVSTLVRIAIRSVALATARKVLGQGEPSDAALARLQADLVAAADAPILVNGLRGERAILDEVILRVGDGRISLNSLIGDQPAADRNPAAEFFVRRMFTSGIDKQRAVGLEWMNEAVAIARLPVHQRAARLKAWEAELDRVKTANLTTRDATLPVLLVPALAVCFSADCRQQADLGATTLLVAAERHRRKLGSWPASIAAIDRAVLPAAPSDPLTGTPFLLERDNGRFLVHSIGPDLKDDHGALDLKRWGRGGPDDVGGAVWDVSLRRRSPPPQP